MKEINENYTDFYRKKKHTLIYPTELVVRTFLASYPGLNMRKPTKDSKVLDIGVGDGRNTLFLCEQQYEVYGTEITQEIVDIAKDRIQKNGYSPDLRVGRNSNLPFEDNELDYALACHVCYYCDEGQTMKDNLAEYSRILKKGGYLIASVAHIEGSIFNGAERLEDGNMLIKNDPYNNRNGYKLKGFKDTAEIEEYFSPWFKNFSFGQAANNYYGFEENVFWVVCEKK